MNNGLSKRQNKNYHATTMKMKISFFDDFFVCYLCLVFKRVDKRKKCEKVKKKLFTYFVSDEKVK